MVLDDEEFERQELMNLLREGLIAQFNDRRHMRSYERVDLSRSELIFAELTGAVLMETDLTESNLSGSNLSESNLKGSFLSNSDLSGSDLRRADLSGADLSGSNLTGAVLTGANLTGANLSDAILAGADLTHALLRSADFRRSDLRNVRLEHAELLAANFEGIRASTEDFTRIGATLEEGGDRSVKTGRFEEARQLYDGADRLYQQAGSAQQRVELYRKLERLAQALGLSSDQVHEHGTRLLLFVSKSKADAAARGDKKLEEEIQQLAEVLRAELGISDEANLPAPKSEVRELTRLDLQRHAEVAKRFYQRFDVETLLLRLGELLDTMDETTVLDLSVRFGIPDLQLAKARETLTGDIRQFDLLRGQNFLEVLKQRLRPTISPESGTVFHAWKKGEEHTLEPLIVILLKELLLSSPYRILGPILAVLFVKTGLARYCSWVVQGDQRPLV